MSGKWVLTFHMKDSNTFRAEEEHIKEFALNDGLINLAMIDESQLYIPMDNVMYWRRQWEKLEE